jgi:hypothetical protein
MSTDNQRLYTEQEFRLLQEELHHEMALLSTLRDQQAQDLARRDDEISKLIMEKKLIEEERSVLRG